MAQAPSVPPPRADGLRSLEELSLGHGRVLMRVDFDVPLDDDGNIASDRKLQVALPSIRKAVSVGARVVLVTHLGALSEPGQPARSLEPVAARLAELLDQDVYLPDECVGDAARKVVSDLRDGQICMLENLRFLPEEAAGDDALARKLLGMCDVFVSEAFSASLFTSASLTTLPRMVKERGVGLRFKAELEELSRINAAGSRPMLGILGGSSLTKSLPVFELMLRRCESICVGGAVAMTLLAAKGLDPKVSSYEKDQLALGRNLLGRARDQKVELLLPTDFVVAGSDAAVEGREVSAGSIPDNTGAFDLGPRTLEAFRGRIGSVKTAWFHGALGKLENPTFAAGTKSVMSALAEAKAFGVVTGESVAAAAAAAGPELEQQIGFVSAGGAASLAYIEGKKLPGVEALRG